MARKLGNRFARAGFRVEWRSRCPRRQRGVVVAREARGIVRGRRGDRGGRRRFFKTPARERAARERFPGNERKRARLGARAVRGVPRTRGRAPGGVSDAGGVRERHVRPGLSGCGNRARRRAGVPGCRGSRGSHRRRTPPGAPHRELANPVARRDDRFPDAEAGARARAREGGLGRRRGAVRGAPGDAGPRRRAETAVSPNAAPARARRAGRVLGRHTRPRLGGRGRRHGRLRLVRDAARRAREGAARDGAVDLGGLRGRLRLSSDGIDGIAKRDGSGSLAAGPERTKSRGKPWKIGKLVLVAPAPPGGPRAFRPTRRVARLEAWRVQRGGVAAYERAVRGRRREESGVARRRARRRRRRARVPPRRRRGRRTSAHPGNVFGDHFRRRVRAASALARALERAGVSSASFQRGCCVVDPKPSRVQNRRAQVRERARRRFRRVARRRRGAPTRTRRRRGVRFVRAGARRARERGRARARREPRRHAERDVAVAFDRARPRRRRGGGRGARRRRREGIFLAPGNLGRARRGRGVGAPPRVAVRRRRRRLRHGRGAARGRGKPRARRRN